MSQSSCALCRDVMSLPPQDRLTHALDIIQTLTGQSTANLVWVRESLGLTKTQSRIVLALNAAHPKLMTKDQLMAVLHGTDWEHMSNVVEVHICHIRAKHPELIENVYGFGFRLSRKLAKANPATPKASDEGAK